MRALGLGFLFVSCKLESCLLCCSVVSLTAFSFTCPQKIFSVEVLTKCPAEPFPACCLPCLVSTRTAVITPWVFDGSVSFLLVPAPFCITKVIYSPAQLEPCFPPQLGVTLPALKNNHGLPAIPLMGSAGAGGGVPCITVTSCSQLPMCWASNSAFQKTLIKKKGPFFSPDCCKWKSFSLGSCGSYLWKWGEQLQYLWQLQKRLNLYFIDMYLRAHKNLIAH